MRNNRIYSSITQNGNSNLILFQLPIIILVFLWTLNRDRDRDRKKKCGIFPQNIYYETLIFENTHCRRSLPSICIITTGQFVLFVSNEFPYVFNVKLKCGIKKENSVIAIIMLHVFNSFLSFGFFF